MRDFAQFVLKVLRWFHIDVYEILKDIAERRMWRRAFPQGGRIDEKGLCIAVPLRSFCSVAQVGRDFARRLAKSSVPFELFDLDYGFSAAGRLPESEVADLLARTTHEIHARNVLVFANAAVRGDRRYVYASQPWWEFECGLLEFKPDVFDGVRHVVLQSDFCADYFRSVAPASVRVHKIRYGYDESWHADEDRAATRRRHGIAGDAFVVMFHFMFGSSARRKNPQGALAAFLKAFSDEPRARLLLKIAEADAASDDYQALLAAIAPIRDRVTIVNACLSRQEILNLIAASDAYLSLHRGEGLGIGMLEAMSVRTPVVCTDYGGNTEFCTSETSYLVDYRMVPNTNTDHFYVGVPEWPEPNVETAARHLRTIFENPSAAQSTADRALAFIRDHFSLASFERDVRQFIEGCRAEQPRLSAPVAERNVPRPQLKHYPRFFVFSRPVKDEAAVT